ncbi:MAG: NADH-quinone oxidoreductase subunit NuoH [Acidobacteria bacterium]|nr:NADH-quinone oxidoreductase subunit NuoH [Acidobacteriota bacterium]
MTNLLIEWLIKIGFMLFILLTAVAYLTFLERKVMSWIQLRVGPNRAGPFGLLQPAADGLKMLLKEDILPTAATKWLYITAPAISVIPALMTFVVIPYGSSIKLFGRNIELHVTNINIALLYIFALTSLGVYGIAIAGWSSNNKYSLMGGLRSSAQMVSYELALGLSIVGVLLCTGTLDLTKIVEWQASNWGGYRWTIFPQLLGFPIFFIAALAETNRTPFDLPEADSELVAGYHTEYSSMKFAMFQMAEYLNLITSVSLSVTLYFGGWLGPGVKSFPWLGPIYFAIKAGIFIFIIMWIRFTLPRFRYDQLMKFGWKVLLPLAILNVILTGTGIMIYKTYFH